MSRIARNGMCPCNSGKKYKHCHLNQQEEINPALRFARKDGIIVCSTCPHEFKPGEKIRWVQNARKVLAPQCLRCFRIDGPITGRLQYTAT